VFFLLKKCPELIFWIILQVFWTILQAISIFLCIFISATGKIVDLSKKTERSSAK
jgi:hypothetical protein